MKLLVINGPNLNLLGLREPDIYGKETYDDLVALVEQTCAEEGIEVTCFQSNHEGAIVDRIQAAYGVCDGIVINPAAYTHTSVAIPDALKAVSLPAVEVHISDVDRREEFRRHSYTSAACIGTIKGRGLSGYADAIRMLKTHLSSRRS
ncbi:MAG: type II 3-dehydroquinate dehydratase [Eubacteriales bacterium]|nr:type II 3-dehydroquinate dehydratase [Eubacteriales bacterium]